MNSGYRGVVMTGAGTMRGAQADTRAAASTRTGVNRRICKSLTRGGVDASKKTLFVSKGKGRKRERDEGRDVLPTVTATGPRPPSGQFVLGLDGVSLGHTHGHGRTLHWWE